MRVAWTEKALDELSDLYVTLSLIEQDAMAKSVAGINRKLAEDPEGVGESRSPWVRVWFTEGFMLRFDIDPAGQRVTVYEVTLVRPRKR
jgi:hypothetical protein